MHSRVILGVTAWLAGAGAATGGSLLAVSMLGQGLTPAAGEQQSVASVNRALASQAAGRTAPPPEPGPPERSTSLPRSSAAAPPAEPPSPAAGGTAPPPPGTGGGTVLTAQGGTLVASCAGKRAYLMSWSPQPGFGVGEVVRGPATDTRVTFTGAQLTVTVVVSCYAGAPTATATTATAFSAAGGDGD